MASYLPSIFRGLLLPDPRFGWDSYDEAESTLTQAGPMAGIPVPSVDSDLILEAVGTYTGSSTYEISTATMGHVGTDGMRFYWEKDGSGDQYGWEPPTSISSFEFVDYTTTPLEYARPHILACSDGTLVCSAVSNASDVIVSTRSASTGAWTVGSSFGAYASAPSQQACLLQLPSGRLLCFYFNEKSSNEVYLQMSYSDDQGTTWTEGSFDCLGSTIDTTDYDITRVRATYLHGQISLWICMDELATFKANIYQYASVNLGAMFSLISEFTDYDRAYVDCVTLGNKIVVAYITDTSAWGADHSPIVRILGSAYENATLGAYYHGQDSTDAMIWASQTGGIYVSGELSLVVDEEGTLYLIGRDHAGFPAYPDVLVRRSYDGGQTWDAVGYGPSVGLGGSVWAAKDKDTYPVGLSACAAFGSFALAHTHVSDPENHDDSLSVAWLGGFSTNTLPNGFGRFHPDDVYGWTRTWLPYDDPPDVGDTIPVWAASIPAAYSFSSDGITLTIGKYYETTDIASTTTSQGVLCQGEVKVIGGRAILNAQISEGGPNKSYRVEVRISTTQILLRDDIAGTTIASANTTDGATGILVRLRLQGSVARCYWAPVGATPTRTWRTLSGLATDGGTNPGMRIQWGSGSLASSESVWKLFQFSDSGWTQGGFGAGNCCGRGMSANPVFVDQGLKIQAADGPAFLGQSWTIEPRYSYGIENVFYDVHASPRRKWRSTSDASDCEIAWSIGAKETLPMGALAALYLGGANFGEAELYGVDNGGTWTKIADLALRTKGVSFDRKDRLLVPSSGGLVGVAHYLHADSLAGSHVHFPGGGMIGPKTRKILTNSPGKWNMGATGQVPRILLESVDTTEGTSPSNAEIWHKDYCVVIALTDEYVGYKLKIPAQTTFQGYFELGVLHFGSVAPLGSYLQEYGWGRAQEWAQSYEQVEGREGIRTVRGLGPVRRSAEISWVDGIETSGLSQDEPDYILGWSGGEPVAVAADVPWSIPGIMAQLSGAEKPVVYLPAFEVPSAAGEIVEIIDPTKLLYGRIMTDTIRADTVLGSEEGTELIRLGTCRIEEEI